jgi:hypothetical protein
MSALTWHTSQDPQGLLNLVRPRANSRKLRLLALSQARRLFPHVRSDDRPACERLLDVAAREADGLTAPDTDGDVDWGSPELNEAYEDAVGQFDLGWTNFLELHDVSWTDEQFDAVGLARWAARDLALFCAAPEPWGAAVWAVRCVTELALRQAAVRRLEAGDVPRQKGEDRYNHLHRLYELCRPQAGAAVGAELCGWVREVFGDPFRPPAVDPAWLVWNGGTVAQIAQAIYAGDDFVRLPVLADALEEAGCADTELLGHCRGPGPHARGCRAVDLVLGKH